MGHRVLRATIYVAFLVGAIQASSLHAESGHDAWLRFARLDARAARMYETLPASVVVLGDSVVLQTAQRELTRGIKGMLGKTLRAELDLPRKESFILGTLKEVLTAIHEIQTKDKLVQDGFWITTRQVGGFSCVIVTGSTDRGVLYGVFALLSKIARNESIAALDERQEPYAPIRWVDQWDNLDGRVERGYAGRSIFFESGAVRDDLSRVGEYARLLASIGVNGCNVNNVNADPRILDDRFLPQLRRIADVFRAWGVQLSLSVDLGSPKTIDGLDTFDPLDSHVADWWHPTSWVSSSKLIPKGRLGRPFTAELPPTQPTCSLVLSLRTADSFFIGRLSITIISIGATPRMIEPERHTTSFIRSMEPSNAM